MLRANVSFDRVDLLSEGLEGPDDGRCFELGGRPFFLVVVQGAGGVGNDALAILLRLEEYRAEAVARVIAIKGDGDWPLAAGGDEAGLRAVFFGNLDLVGPLAHVEDGEAALAIERGEDVVGAEKRLLRDADVLVDGPKVAAQAPGCRGLADHDNRGTPAAPAGLCDALASRSGTASRTSWSMTGERRRGGVQMGGGSPVSKRAVSKLVARSGVLPSLKRSRTSYRSWRSCVSSSGCRQLLGEQKGNEAAVDLFVRGRILRLLRRVWRGRDAEAWTYAGGGMFVLARGNPADILSHGATAKQARVATDEGIEFIAVALENEGVLGEADADLIAPARKARGASAVPGGSLGGRRGHGGGGGIGGVCGGRLLGQGRPWRGTTALACAIREMPDVPGHWSGGRGSLARQNRAKDAAVKPGGAGEAVK
ncbi:hypothetical protein ACSSS7_008075 [Eimeria intestinalis]